MNTNPGTEHHVISSSDSSHCRRAAAVRNTRFLLAALCIFAAAPAAALEGPQGWLRGLVVDQNSPNNVYVAGYSGANYQHRYLYRSKDHGRTWSSTEIKFSTSKLVIGPYDPSTNRGVPWMMYATTYEKGVMRSKDGKTWKRGTGINGSTRSIAVHPNGTTVFAASHKGLYRSLDQGKNWSLFWDRETNDIAIDRKNPLNMYAIVEADDVYRTTDGGFTWEPSVDGLPSVSIGRLYLHPRDASKVYVVSQYDAIYESVDGGLNWVRLDPPENSAGTPSRLTYIAIDRKSPTTMFGIELDSDVFKSHDGGRSWKNISKRFPLAYENNPTSNDYREVAISPNGSGHVYVATIGSGFFVSDDYGDSWKQVSELPPPPRPIEAPEPGEPLCIPPGTCQDDGGGSFGPVPLILLVLLKIGLCVARKRSADNPGRDDVRAGKSVPGRPAANN